MEFNEGQPAQEFIEKMKQNGFESIALAINNDTLKFVSCVFAKEETLAFCIYRMLLDIGNEETAKIVSYAAMAAAHKIDDKDIDDAIGEMFNNLGIRLN